MARVNLSSPKTVVLKKVDISTYEIIQCVDSRNKKMVTAMVMLGDEPIPKCFILWKDEQYDAIGEWTDEQADARISELINEL